MYHMHEEKMLYTKHHVFIYHRDNLWSHASGREHGKEGGPIFPWLTGILPLSAAI